MTTEEYQAKKRALLAEIERVFDGVERGDGVTLHEADVIDSYGEGDRAKARLKDKDTRWQEVSHEDISRMFWILPFRDPKAFRYYIPAYLTWYLMNMDDNPYDSGTFEALDEFLVAGNGFTPDWSYILRFWVLSGEQSRVVAHFLEFRLERDQYLFEQEQLQRPTNDESWVNWMEGEADKPNHKARLALKNYWGKFLK